jgi:hypothetical protein
MDSKTVNFPFTPHSVTNVNPFFSSQLRSSVLGEIESVQIVMLSVVRYIL